MYVIGYFKISKIRPNCSHISKNGIFCCMSNIGDVKSYWAAFHFFISHSLKSIYLRFHNFSLLILISIVLETKKIFEKLTSLFPTKDMQTPSPQFWSGFYERCAMCWIEWKPIFRFLFFELSWTIHRKLGYKNDHNSINKNWKIDFSFDSAHSASFFQILILLKKKNVEFFLLFKYWYILWSKVVGFFPIKDMQTPSPSPLEVVRFLWKMRNVLNRMKNKMIFFSIFIFRVMGENLSKIGVILGTKMTITRKIKIGNLIFLSIQPIPDLSCKFK